MATQVLVIYSRLNSSLRIKSRHRLKSRKDLSRDIVFIIPQVGWGSLIYPIISNIKEKFKKREKESYITRKINLNPLKQGL